jgi:hypothetical protein
MTTAQRLADALFAQLTGQPLLDWIADRRDAGDSWHQISVAFYDVTGVSVTDVSLQNWSTGSRSAA